MIIIIGASGFIGSHIYEQCIRSGRRTLGTCFHARVGMIQFDMREQSLPDLLDKANITNPTSVEALIVCSADASIDHCFLNKDYSYALNVTGTKRLLYEASQLGIKTVFFSSEAVFDGKKGFYRETDMVCPITLYGHQKVEIEQYIEENVEKCLMLRVSRAVGNSFNEKDIFHEFWRNIDAGKEIKCLRGQTFSLTWVGDIAKATMLSLDKGIVGVYHVSNSSMITRYELACQYVKAICGNYEKIGEYTYKEMSFADQRHVLSGLDGTKLANELGMEFKSVAEILEDYRQTFLANRES